MIFWILLVLGVAFTISVYLNLVPFNTRYIYLALLGIGIIYSTFLYGLTADEFGISPPTMNSIMIYSVVTFIAWIIMKKTKVLLPLAPVQEGSLLKSNTVFLYFMFSVPLQNMVLRAYPLAIFSAFGWNLPLYYIGFTAVIFSFAHVYFKSIHLVLYAFIMGIIWNFLYYYYQDFFSLCISHCILGYISMWQKNHVRIFV